MSEVMNVGVMNVGQSSPTSSQINEISSLSENLRKSGGEPR